MVARGGNVGVLMRTAKDDNACTQEEKQVWERRGDARVRHAEMLLRSTSDEGTNALKMVIVAVAGD